MTFLFRPPLSEEAEGSSVLNEERTEKRELDVPDGLIPATELPSAVDVLAELFREDSPPPPSERSTEPASNEEVGADLAEEKETEPAPPVSKLDDEIEEHDDKEDKNDNEDDTDNKSEAVPVESTAAEPIAPDVSSSVEAEQEAEIDPATIELAEKAVDEVAKAEVAAIAHGHDVSTSAAAPLIPVAASDWAFEERLANHKEWVESRGVAGTKANFAGANLEDAELIGVNLRHADLQDANLKSADLLLADLRDACMVRTNLQESCLVGANLEGANLEGATLDTAMGLVPRQLAGANLHEASLPEQIAEFESRPEFERTSQVATAFFNATMAICAVSCLVIWKTKDIQLLSDSSILPFLHSQTASAALPTAQIYLIAPVVLFLTYVTFHFHLQRLWDAVLELPGIFPNGRELGQDGPRVITGLLRAHFRWMNREAASTRIIERVVALLLAYWIVPITLVLFWARYLTLQDLHGTMLHELLAVVSAGVALYSTTKIGRPQERWTLDTKHQRQWISKLREVNPLSSAIAFGLVLTFLAIGTIKGSPHDNLRAPQFGPANIRRWAPTFFWSLGYDPYADLTEASLSTRPANWTGADEQVSSVRGARLNNISFRYAQAYGVFLANAHLWRADFQGAFLSDADLRSADLGQSTLRYAIMDRARLNHVNLDRSDLDGANLDRADFRESNLSYCLLTNAILVDAQFQGSTLYGARLMNASMDRANLEKADVRSAYLDNANLEHADLQQAYFWSAKLPGANLRNAQLASAIFIDASLRDANLQGAQLAGTVLNGTDLTGATIDGTDLRGALGLTPSQVCSTKSRNGAILADALAAQVQAACGGPLLAAPAAAPQTQPVPNNAASKPANPTSKATSNPTTKPAIKPTNPASE